MYSSLTNPAQTTDSHPQTKASCAFPDWCSGEALGVSAPKKSSWCTWRDVLLFDRPYHRRAHVLRVENLRVPLTGRQWLFRENSDSTRFLEASTVPFIATRQPQGPFIPLYQHLSFFFNKWLFSTHYSVDIILGQYSSDFSLHQNCLKSFKNTY